MPAINDIASVSEDTTFLGNVLRNDVLITKVAGISFNGLSYTIPATGLPLFGKFGKLVMYSTGNYTYEAYQGLSEGEGGTDVFTYTGATLGLLPVFRATLSITVSGTNDVPTYTWADKPVVAVTEAGESLGSFAATDVDQGSVLTYSVELSEADAGALEIDGEGSLTIGDAALEMDRSYQFKVTVSDEIVDVPKSYAYYVGGETGTEVNFDDSDPSTPAVDALAFMGGGDDSATGGAGDDTLYGGAGSDELTGGGGKNVLSGGSGEDTINVTFGNDMIDLKGITASADGDRIIGFGAGSNGDQVVLAANDTSAMTNSGNLIQFQTVNAAPAAAVTFNSNSSDLVELAFNLGGNNVAARDLDGGQTGAQLLAAIGRPVSVSADGGKLFILAYQGGNAYLYHAEDRTTGDVQAATRLQSEEIKLVGVFETVAVGALSEANFVLG